MKPIYLCLGATLTLSACAMGPNAPKPEPLKSSAYEANSDAVRAVAMPDQWWRGFGSDAINHLVDEALRANPDLKSAEYNLAAAQEIYSAQKAALWPTSDLSYGYQHAKNADSLSNPLGGNNPPSLYSLHTASLDVSYGLDIWGGTRRSVEQQKAIRDSVIYQTQAARQALIANVVATAVNVAGLKLQVSAAQQSSLASQQALDMMKRQKDLGAVSVVDLAQFEANLAQDQANEAQLTHSLNVTTSLLKALLGKENGELLDVDLDLDQIHEPEQMPYIVPSELIKKRADIGYAMANLRAASASVGMAQAARLPSFSLDGSTGGAALSLAHLLDQPNQFWSLGANLSAPLISQVPLYHQQKAAEANFAAAKAQYRSAVIAALKDVANSLDSVHQDHMALGSAALNRQAAQKAYEFAQKQLELGDGGRLSQIAALRGLAQAQISYASQKAQSLSDMGALYLSFGG